MLTRFAYYFSHIKQAIGRHWSPAVALDRAYPGGARLPSEVFTELTIVVERDGQISSVSIKCPSGVAALDHEAVRAVGAAGGFPRPPADLLDTAGQLRFDFGFLVTTGGRGSNVTKP